MLSRRGRSLDLTTVAQYRLKLRKRTSRMPGRSVELLAEPVAEPTV